jgi:polyisoprenoid-binding protein YceI
MDMRNRTLHLVVLCLVAGSMVGGAASLHGPGTVLDLDATLTKVEFTLGDVLHTVHGSFKLKSGSIHFDPATGQASGAMVIYAASGASGSGARDRRMQKNILESETFPEITFTPDRFDGHLSPDGESEIDLHGMFAIHGSAHEMILKTKVLLRGDQLSASTHFAIPYVQWGMKNPSTLFLRVNDKVMIDLQAVGRLR